MAYPKPKHSKAAINRAGRTLLFYITDSNKKWGDDEGRSIDILSNFRSCHGYPINTFQSTLRNKLRLIDREAFVMQRLKRLVSILWKLKRFSGMKLARMQDIGGLRAVTSTLKKDDSLKNNYLRGHSNFKHTLHLHKDYIKSPKLSGYRGIHLVYKYKNDLAPEYEGLFIELQIRTRMQHYWATAVETMGTYLKRSLKSSEGPKEWLRFFSLAGSAFAHLEKTPPVPGYEKLSSQQTYHEVADAIGKMDVINTLEGYAIATQRVVTKQGAYHLIVLDLDKRDVAIYSYPKSDLNNANIHYAKVEREATEGKNLQVVLVSAGSIRNLKRAYPNYFLDSRKFIGQLKTINKLANKPG